MIHNIESHGVRSMGDGDATIIETSHIIVFCSPEQIEAIVATLRPIFKKFGGAYYVSDAITPRSLNGISLS